MSELNTGMAKYRCDYCQCEISGIRVKCAECKDFDLCLQCFSCGAEIGPHKNDHSYGIAGGSDISAFESPKLWTLSEETMLLDAVEQYGFGNWEDAATHVESALPSECEQHYIDYYIHGNIGKVTFQTESENRITDHTCPDGGPLSPSITVPVTPVDLSLQEQQELGYMPYRDDFEREFDNEAEGSISALSNNYDDDELDITIKLIQVDRYRLRIKEREQRKRIAREYGLINAATSIGSKQKVQQPKKRKDEREFQEKMRIFSQFHLAAEHEAYFENLQKEKELKARIKEMMKLRKNGLTTLSDVETYAEEKYKREKKKENRKKTPNQAKRNSMVPKKLAVEEKLDILIDDDDIKDEEEEEENTKEMAQLPGYDMLSEREKKLCNSIGMTPANYVTIKTCIIKDYLQRRQGLPVKIRYPSGLDKTHRRKIMSFLTDNGWIGVT